MNDTYKLVTLELVLHGLDYAFTRQSHCYVCGTPKPHAVFRGARDGAFLGRVFVCTQCGAKSDADYGVVELK
jgi:hypothetical protein